MTDPNYTAICLLVDRSGSMRTIQAAAQDSINEFVESQKERDGRTTIRIVQFDAPTSDWRAVSEADWYLVHCPSIDVANAPPFKLFPRGMTALYDAMGRAIDEFGAELAALPERNRPGTVIFAALTDGQENSSKEFTAAAIRSTVTRQTDVFGWHFLYLGANQDAILEGERMGIPRASSVTYSASPRGTRAVMDWADEAVAMASSGRGISITDEERRRMTEGS